MVTLRTVGSTFTGIAISGFGLGAYLTTVGRGLGLAASGGAAELLVP